MLPSPHTLSRRRLLKLASVGGLASVGCVLRYAYAPWLSYEAQANRVRDVFQLDQPQTELIRYATLAASGHNTQPWKFTLLPNVSVIEIHPDYARRLPSVDPSDRELWISLGCALENLRIAALAAGLSPTITYPDTTDFISVQLSQDSRQKSPLFDAIPLRQNTRSEYDGQSLKSRERELIEAIEGEPGITLHFLFDPPGLGQLQELVSLGNLSQFADKAFLKELTSWIRFNKREALASLDGLYAPCSGSPQVPRWLGRLFIESTTPQKQAASDAKKLLSSSGAVVVSSANESKSDWVRTGQVYERLALTLTSRGLKSAFLNQPIEVPDVRTQLQSTLGLGSAQPQLLVRFGFAESLSRSLRRPVEQVLL